MWSAGDTYTGAGAVYASARPCKRFYACSYIQFPVRLRRTAMPLQLRPNCEYCDRDLPADCIEARICSYECTFCADCVEGILHNVCPNCGGGFAPRPIRPSTQWRPGLSLSKQPA